MTPQQDRRSLVEAPAHSGHATVQPPTFTLANTLVMIVGSLILGAIYSFLILKTGLITGINMVSVLLTYCILKLVLRRKHIDARETNLIQTSMTTAGYTAFMIVVIAALDMLGTPLSPWLAFLWLIVSASLGTLMVVPLRRQVIEVEQMPFPHGKAATEILKALEDPTGPGLKKAKAMNSAGLLAIVFVIIRDGLRKIPAAIANQYKVGSEFSLMLLGLGALISLRIGIWMLITALLTWGVAAPALIHSGIALETARAFGLEKDLAQGAYYSVLMRWTLWPATMILISSGLTSIAIRWRTFRNSFRSFVAAAKGPSTQQDMSFKSVAGGILILTAILSVIQYWGFKVSPGITVIAVVISVPFMLVGLQIKGETGIAPISIVASVVQLFFGAISPGSISANMAASGTTASVAMASENLMDDMKTAQGVGNRPQALTVIQLVIGIPFGTLITVLNYPLLKSAYGFGENGLPAPTAHKWQGLAQLLSQGWSVLPKSSVIAIVVAIVAGIVLALLEERWPKWTPSTMGIGTALLLPAQTMLPMAIGSILAAIFTRFYGKKSDLYLVPVASGMIAGEAITSLLISLLRILHVT